MHITGTNLSSLIQMRNAPIFGCVFEARTEFTSNDQGEWYKLMVSNPSLESGVSAWVIQQETYEKLKVSHLALKEAHAKNLIRVEHEDEEDADPQAAAAADGGGKF
jgi:hypothetical protein